MLFNSFTFFVFLMLAFAIFAALPVRYRWTWLLAASYVFYGYANAFNLVYLIAVTAVSYGCGLGIGNARIAVHRKLWLSIGLVTVLGGLFAFKFHDFLASETELLLARWSGTTKSPFTIPRLGIATPVGYSFYAFMVASYLIDTYRTKIWPNARAGDLALYIAFFPKILAGPIERAGHFLPQLRNGLKISPEYLTPGLQLIFWGLIKKVVIADNLAPLVDRTFKIAAFASPIELMTAVYFFAFQIYCDFSGYTDIAIGVALLFGIRLMENFRRPYLSRSTAEFWGARWHISLGHWFRDYLYIPLGGSKVGTLRRYLNVMAVFIVSGLWHAGLGYGVGWTFMVWGALNGLYQWVELATGHLRQACALRMPALAESLLLLVIRILVTFHLIAFAWIFFRAESLADAWVIISRLSAALPTMPALLLHYPFTAEHMFGAALILFLVSSEVFHERKSVSERLAAMPRALRWGVYYVGLATLLVLGRWQSREFIYMQF